MTAGLALVAVGCTVDGSTDPLDAVVGVRASGCAAVDEVGTGFAAGSGLVLTTAHTVRGADRVVIEPPAGDALPARVVALDLVRDVALLAADGFDGAPLELATGAGPGPAELLVRSGDVARREPIAIRRRVTANVEEPADDARYEREALELAARIGPGDSGAPVLDDDGKVAGMAFASSRRDDARAYAVAADELAAVVARTPPDRRSVDTGTCV